MNNFNILFQDDNITCFIPNEQNLKMLFQFQLSDNTKFALYYTITTDEYHWVNKNNEHCFFGKDNPFENENGDVLEIPLECKNSISNYITLQKIPKENPIKENNSVIKQTLYDFNNIKLKYQEEYNNIREKNKNFEMSLKFDNKGKIFHIFYRLDALTKPIITPEIHLSFKNISEFEMEIIKALKLGEI